MEHIGYKVFYKAAFDLQASKNSRGDILWDMIEEIRYWITVKYRKKGDPLPEKTQVWSDWKRGKTIRSKSGQVVLYSCFCLDEQKCYWACQIKEPPAGEVGCAPREWMTEIGFCQTEPGAATITLITAYLDRPGFIGPCQDDPDFNTPGIIHRLRHSKRLSCSINGYVPTDKPLHFVPGQYYDFWKLVSNPLREIPVVYISPRTMDDKTESTLLDPEYVARILDMNAIVCYADSVDFSREMTQLCPQEYACYSGSIRIYAGHPRETDDGRRHRLITANQLLKMQDQSDSMIYEILRRALVQDVHFYDDLFTVENCRRKKDALTAQKRISELKEREQNSTSTAEEILNAAADSEQEKRHIEETLLETQIRNETLQQELDDARKEIKNANVTAGIYREQAANYNEVLSSLEKMREFHSYPSDAKSVVEYISLHYSDRIFFTERALKSLNDCNTKAEVLWNALCEIGDTLYGLWIDGSYTDLEAAFNSRSSNFKYKRGQGSMTRADKNLMRQYEDTYCNRKINVEAHIACGNDDMDQRSVRIYLCLDPETSKIVISHIGKHLDNYSTRKL